MKQFENHKNDVINIIKEIFTDNLISIIVYGSYVRGNYIHGRSDINFLIVRKARTIEELIKLHKYVKQWHRKFKIASPLILTLDEIKCSSDIYPMEYHDIKDHHNVLFGDEIFNTLEISLSNLRLELEHQVKSKLIYLRQSLINFGDNKKILHIITIRTFPSILVILKNCLVLNQKTINPDIDLLINDVEELIKIPFPVLKKINKIKTEKQKLNKKEIIELYKNFVNEIELLADYIDQFKVG